MHHLGDMGVRVGRRPVVDPCDISLKPRLDAVGVDPVQGAGARWVMRGRIYRAGARLWRWGGYVRGPCQEIRFENVMRYGNPDDPANGALVQGADQDARWWAIIADLDASRY